MTPQSSNRPQPQAQDPEIFRVSLRVPDREALAKAIRELGLDIDHQHPQARPGQKEVIIQAFLSQRQIDALKERAGWEVRVEENLSDVGRKRQQEVGKGDRFEGGKVPPKGLGKKTQRGK